MKTQAGAELCQVHAQLAFFLEAQFNFRQSKGSIKHIKLFSKTVLEQKNQSPTSLLQVRGEKIVAKT